jgi:hypothetical protein
MGIRIKKMGFILLATVERLDQQSLGESYFDWPGA